MQAAAKGDLDHIRSVLDDPSSDIENVLAVRVRPHVQGQRVKGRPATALHAASAAGARDIVELLIDRGADPSARMQWLRALTPLHVAVTPEIACLLLSGGAPAVALDPREPDPVWYHRQQGRETVALAIAAWRRLHMPAPSPRTLGSSSEEPLPARKPPVVPALCAAELRSAIERFQLTDSQAKVLFAGWGHRRLILDPRIVITNPACPRSLPVLTLQSCARVPARRITCGTVSARSASDCLQMAMRPQSRWLCSHAAL